MPSPLAFISYDFKLSNNERQSLIAGIGSCSEPFDVDDWSAQRKAPREDWDKLVHGKIWRSDFLIVLVATDMDREAVELEILEAKRCNVPFFGIYVGDAKSGTALPSGLPANRVIPNDWDRIALAVRQVAKEGKHHTFT